LRQRAEIAQDAMPEGDGMTTTTPDQKRPSKDYYLEFYACIGRAIVQWTHVEDALCRVYISAIGLNHRKVASPYRLPATAAFHAIISPDAKAQMANAAISIYLM
jgi:hypothetical protein